MRKPKKASPPYTAETQIYKQQGGGFEAWIVVSIKAPSRIEAMIDELPSGFHSIPSAILVNNLEDVSARARGWKKTRHMDLESAMNEELDGEIRVIITPARWHAIGVLCGKLGITAGDWYLASAAYNARINEQQIDAMLSSIPEVA